MSFEGVWGFNPAEVPKRHNRSRQNLPHAEYRGYSAQQEQAARIPSEPWAQVAELWRMIRLEYQS